MKLLGEGNILNILTAIQFSNLVARTDSARKPSNRKAKKLQKVLSKEITLNFQPLQIVLNSI